MAAADAMSRNQTLLERKEAFKAAAQKLLESKATAAAKDKLDAEAKDEEDKQETKSKAPQSRKSQNQSAITILSTSTVPKNQAAPPSKRKAAIQAAS